MVRRSCTTPKCLKWANLNAEGFCPSCKPPPANITEPIMYLCGICNQEVEESDEKVIGCDLCGKWYHQNCAKCPDALLTILHSINNESEDNQSLLGNLLWICTTCNSEPTKLVEICKNSCKSVIPDHNPSTNENGPPTTGRSIPICKKYRHGACHDNNCEFSHPNKCLAYCRYGRKGCSGGFDNCKLLHPVLCRRSLNFNECFDQNCTLAHLKGTKRYPDQYHSQQQTHFNQLPSNANSYGKGRVSYRRADPNMLGFQGYNPQRIRPSMHQRHELSQGNSRMNNNTHSENYVYNPQDFPDPLTSSQNPPKQVPNDVFLELLNSVKLIQSNQQAFQQELMHLKMMIPPPPTQQTSSGSFNLQSHNQPIIPSM